MSKRLISFLALMAAGHILNAQTPDYEAAARFSTKKVSQMVFSTKVSPNWFRDSDKFWYVWQSPEGTHYYIVDPDKGTKTEVFDMEKLAMELTTIVRDPFDARHIPIQKFELKDDKVFRFDIRSSKEVPDTSATEKNAEGPKKMMRKTHHFEYDIASGKLSEYKPEKPKYPRWACVSPDGQTAVYMKNSNLFWMDRENLAKAAVNEKDSTLVEHRLTSDGTNENGYGFSTYRGNTEKDSTKRCSPVGLCWSPDSKHFAIKKNDVSMVKELWVINSVNASRPELESYKYQMPGETGPQEQLFIFNLKTGERKAIKTTAWKEQELTVETRPYTAKDVYTDYYTTVWLGDERGFYANRVSRDQKKIDYVRIDIASDSTRTLISERMNSFIECKDLRLIRNGTQIIEWSERNGWANLYLYTSEGKLLRNLTEGAYHVSSIVSVNEKENYVLFIACGVNKDENPYHEHLYRVSLNGGPISRLDVDDMDHKAIGSDDGKYVVLNYSRVDSEPCAALVDGKGKLTHLETADLSKLYEAGYKMPERFTVKAADGVTDLYGVMYKPFNFDPSKKYPVIEYVYPGPQVEGNDISWSKSMLRKGRLAQIGFIVITVGNRGGHPDRSKWYHNFGYGNLRDYGLEDQKLAVERLASRYPFIDASRVGIFGHSGGGFMSTAAILKYPDFYKVAVSCAGNHDNRIYNRWWSEQHHGVLEQVNEKGDTTFLYKISTNPEIAGNLKGHLMLVHGDIDNNVHPANTIRVADALIRANKRFDMLILPGQRHSFGDMNEYFFYRLADYFSEWLLSDSEREETDIRWMNND